MPSSAMAVSVVVARMYSLHSLYSHCALTLCTYTVHSHCALTLHSHCTHCTHCSPTVPVTVQSLCSHCTHVVHPTATHCTHTVLRTRTVRTPRYGTHCAHISYMTAVRTPVRCSTQCVFGCGVFGDSDAKTRFRCPAATATYNLSERFTPNARSALRSLLLSTER